MDSRAFLVGTRCVRRFMPRGCVRERRVWGGRIRRPEGPRRGDLSQGDCVTFRRSVGQCAVRRLRLALTSLRSGPELGLWRSSAALHGQTEKRRAFSGERFARRRLHNAERFEQSVLPAQVPLIAPRLSRSETRGSAALRKVQNAPTKGRPREASFPRASSAELSALCLPTGVGATCSGKTCLVFAGRRLCRMFGRFLFGAALRVFGVASRAFGPQPVPPPFKP